jgi:predicted transcriptional regulator
MLDHFFGSKARVKILKLFLLNPDGNYYLRQLARDLDLQVNSVRRELKNLEAFGLLQIGSQKTSSSTSNDSTFLRDPSILNNEKKYYQVNKEFYFRK